MSNKTDIVIDALRYYDKNTEKYEKAFKNARYHKILYNKSDIDHNKITFYDEHKKPILTSKFEIIGVYDNIPKTWIWAWSNPYFSKNTTYISRKILNYGLDLDSSTSFLKSELISSRFRISSFVQLDLHVAIASYISKNPVIYKLIIDSNAPFEFGIKSESDITKSDTFIPINTDKSLRNNYTIYYLYMLDYDKIKL